MGKRTPIPTWFFALVVVRDGSGRFLVVKEKKHGQRWYLPAGRVEPGETLVEGAIRETLEESGVEVKIESVIRFEHSPKLTGARVRVIFLARMVGGKPGPTADSLDARFVSFDELALLELRWREVIDIFSFVNRCESHAPLSILACEGASFEL